MTKIREGVPIPSPGAVSGLDEGVDTFNDLLEIVTRCLPDGPDPFTQAAYLWAGLHGLVAFRLAIPAFPWPSERDYLERMIQVHIESHADPSPAAS
jgi:AcrR family transcriptional regulator